MIPNHPTKDLGTHMGIPFENKVPQSERAQTRVSDLSYHRTFLLYLWIQHLCILYLNSSSFIKKLVYSLTFSQPKLRQQL